MHSMQLSAVVCDYCDSVDSLKPLTKVHKVPVITANSVTSLIQC